MGTLATDYNQFAIGAATSPSQLSSPGVGDIQTSKRLLSVVSNNDTTFSSMYLDGILGNERIKVPHDSVWSIDFKIVGKNVITPTEYSYYNTLTNSEDITLQCVSGAITIADGGFQLAANAPLNIRLDNMSNGAVTDFNLSLVRLAGAPIGYEYLDVQVQKIDNTDNWKWVIEINSLEIL